MKLPLPGSMYGTPSLPSWMLVHVVRHMHQQHEISCKIGRADIKEIYGALCMIAGEAHRQNGATLSQDVLQSIDKVRRGILNAREVLEAGREGMHPSEHIHALFRIQDALVDELQHEGREPLASESSDHRVARDDAVERFLEVAEPLQAAADKASKLLRNAKGQKGGSKPIAYDQFLGLMHAIADHFQISTKVIIDRTGRSDGGEKSGPFLVLVRSMEQFLPEYLRTASSNAAAKRIERFAKRKRPTASARTQ